MSVSRVTVIPPWAFGAPDLFWGRWAKGKMGLGNPLPSFRRPLCAAELSASLSVDSGVNLDGVLDRKRCFPQEDQLRKLDISAHLLNRGEAGGTQAQMMPRLISATLHNVLVRIKGPVGSVIISSSVLTILHRLSWESKRGRAGCI